MNDRLELFEAGRQKCRALLEEYPDNIALTSIDRQIEYLIGLESGVHSDRSRLNEIVIGVLTAREIEPLNGDVAETFYKIASAAKQM